jgi:2-polyprenyl-3-methyl-5-hydroxy-6-metoxy-1,4-benzoquinol methylase
MFHNKLINYNLELFVKLNDEYRHNKLVSKPRNLDLEAQKIEGINRSRRIEKLFESITHRKLSGLRFLEIGCGRGNTSFVVANSLKCQVTAVDIFEYPQWKTYTHPNLKFKKIDISAENIQDLGKFDMIYSKSVWEHILHPYSALKAAKELLDTNGVFYISANLYRGPKASHRYREVFFPWPHLLFKDEIFYEFYKTKNKSNMAAWVNKLVAAQYLLFFNELKFQIKELTFSKTDIDENFYKRFNDILGRYPKYDLEKDFINAVLIHK